MLLRPFDTCFKPERIYNRHTHSIEYVSCGKCEACINKKGDYQSKMIDAEYKKHRFTLFFTLTYNNASIPCFKRFTDENGFSRLIPIGRIASDDGYFSSLPWHPFVTDDGIKRKKLSFHRNINATECVEDSVFLPVIQNSNFDKDVFGVLCKQDLIRFFKRFRKRLDEEFKREPHRISYYACGEYGPTTYRPHFHVLLFFDNEKIIEKLQTLIFESWGRFERLSGQGRNRFTFRPFQAFDRFQYKSATNKNGNLSWVTGSGNAASRYVSSYVTGHSDLPKVLQLKAFRPFTLHSKGDTFGSTATDRKEVYDHFKKGFEHRNDYFSAYKFRYDRDVTFTPQGGVPVTVGVPFPRFILDSLWSKPFGYRLLPDSTKSAIITFICRNYNGSLDNIRFFRACMVREHNFEYFSLAMDHPQNWSAALKCYRFCKQFNIDPNEFVQVYEFSLFAHQQYKLKVFYDLQNELIKHYPQSVLVSAYSNVFEDLPINRPAFPNFYKSTRLMLSLGVSLDEIYKNGYLDREFVTSLHADSQPVYQAWKSDVLNINFNRNKSKFKENYAQIQVS